MGKGRRRSMSRTLLTGESRELLWAVYGCIQALEKSCKQSHHRLAANWQQWFDYAKTNVVRVFYQGDGHVCAVTSIGNQSLPISDPKQTYKCESPSYLDDPYEGELFTNFIHLFSDLAQSEKNKILEVKKKKLVATEYSVGDVGPITVEQGEFLVGVEPIWRQLIKLFRILVFCARALESIGDAILRH